MADVTHILNAIEQGDPNAADGPPPLVYDECSKPAGEMMARGRYPLLRRHRDITSTGILSFFRADCRLSRRSRS
jgi:hypothetical protein